MQSAVVSKKSSPDEIEAAIRERLRAGGAVSEVAREVADELGVRRRDVYRRALSLSADAD